MLFNVSLLCVLGMSDFIFPFSFCRKKSIYDAESPDKFLKFGKFKFGVMKNVILPDIGQQSLSYYLAMEEHVASVIDDEAFFVWQSEPTVIIGRNQDLEAEVNI